MRIETLAGEDGFLHMGLAGESASLSPLATIVNSNRSAFPTR
jgi:hypothetical protein